jgi:hypothetical protein
VTWGTRIFLVASVALTPLLASPELALLSIVALIAFALLLLLFTPTSFTMPIKFADIAKGPNSK